jgi:hypothetical protein
MTEVLLRVLIDTNIWISAFINPSGIPARILRLALDDRYQLIVSHSLLAVMFWADHGSVAACGLMNRKSKRSSGMLDVKPSGQLHLA